MLEFLSIELFIIGLSLSLSQYASLPCLAPVVAPQSAKCMPQTRRSEKKPRPRRATVNEVLVSVPLKRQKKKKRKKKLMCATTAREESRVNHSHGARFCDEQLQARNVGRHAGARRIAADSGGSEGADGQHGGGFERVGRCSTEESVKTRTSRC
ncbi:uncharacterized protein IWZ02DRAFT_39522 [Phyllosticta citriasiana]|uniref:uncharacterized protein n=1 Tax=Phyllosticta citriasiana TaxID=595635 RepID=UPI0030FD62DC